MTLPFAALVSTLNVKASPSTSLADKVITILSSSFVIPDKQ